MRRPGPRSWQTTRRNISPGGVNWWPDTIDSAAHNRIPPDLEQALTMSHRCAYLARAESPAAQLVAVAILSLSASIIKLIIDSHKWAAERRAQTSCVYLALECVLPVPAGRALDQRVSRPLFTRSFICKSHCYSLYPIVRDRFPSSTRQQIAACARSPAQQSGHISRSAVQH